MTVPVADLWTLHSTQHYQRQATLYWLEGALGFPRQLVLLERVHGAEVTRTLDYLRTYLNDTKFFVDTRLTPVRQLFRACGYIAACPTPTVKPLVPLAVRVLITAEYCLDVLLAYESAPA